MHQMMEFQVTDLSVKAEANAKLAKVRKQKK
jgi:hypothetical protein